MRIHHLVRSLLAGSLVLSTSCSGEKPDRKPAISESDASPQNPDNEAGAGGTGALCLDDSQACATAPAQPVGRQPDGVLEVQLTNTPDRKEGEPTLAINPTDPNNLVAIYASFLPGVFLGDNVYGCFAQYSMDRGETWTLVEPWPPDGIGPHPDCGESVIEVDADGRFYAGMNNLLNTTDILLGFNANLDKALHVVSSSSDGGRTWSKPVQTYRIPGVIKARVDQVTGKLYHSVSHGGLFPAALTVSSDHGQTWSEPVQQAGNQFAVHDGILIMTAEAPSILINVSTDDGKTYTQALVTDSKGMPVPAGASGLQDPTPWITADPTASRRFAVMVPQTTGGRLQGFVPLFDSYDVYVTDDLGETWTGPTTLRAPWSALPWIEFGSDGALGVTWRGITSKDGTPMVDAYAAVSFDQGRTFSAAVRVSAESHPWGDSGPPADDWSGISLDDEFAFVTWVDVRSGATGDAIMARVPLSVFRAASD